MFEQPHVRVVCGYKRQASILNVSSLIGWARAKGPGYDMAEYMNG